MISSVYVGDFHVGHLVGLCSPEVPLDQGGAYKASDFQKRLYEKYHECATGLYPRPDYVVYTGDGMDGQGSKARGVEQWTTNVELQVAEAERLLRLWKPKCGFICVRGSDYHVSINGLPMDEELARRLDAMTLNAINDKGSVLQSTSQERAEDGQDRRRSQEVVYLPFIEHWKTGKKNEGYTVQVAHALGFTRTWQYRSTAITREMLMAKVEDRMLKQIRNFPKTKAIVRGHVHFSWEVGSTSSRGIIVPCWQGLTPYMVKGSASALPDIGFWALEVRGNDGDWGQFAWSVETVQTPPVIVCTGQPRRKTGANS